MISMSRTSSNLTLRWGNKKGDAVDVEVRRRENSSGTWNTSKFQVNKAMLTLEDLQHQQVYQLQLRQKSKIAKHPLWSDWTPILNVPTEIQDPPEVNWTVVDFSNGTRLLKLNWGISTYPVSVGQVNYNLSLHIWPCQTNQKNWSNIKSTEFNVSVTYSAVSGSIAAFNKVGNVQQRNFLIPAKHLTNCSKAWRIDKPTPHKYVPVLKKSCLEWYKLTDGETSPHKVNIIVKQVNETLQTIRKEMDDYLPYYYFVHHQSDKRLPQTIEMCLMYKMEGVPRKAPENVTVHSTTTSAVLHWNHIPLSHRQGFLTYYKICYRRTQNGKGNAKTECHNISASETEYSIQNLTPQSTYEIQLSGGTVAGFGPPETINVMTQTQFPGWIIPVVVLIGISITLCFIYIKRHQSKIFPPIPRPVVVEYSIFRVRNQDMDEIKEEVHELQLHDKRSKEPKSEETNLLNVCRRYECEDTDENSLGDPMSPEYEGQVLRLETVDSNPAETDCEVAMLMYRNGLVFDMKAEYTEDAGTPL
ncbi:interleukin-12 receptor subunit beta-1 isoform X2 [Esox lucius]|nr:interleukin-12 receptor subunit beta-1 isoform X2 [Esox lucius]